jgi:hypothetical protein
MTITIIQAKLKYKFYWSEQNTQRYYTHYFKFASAIACIWHSSYLENLHFTVGF